jgi:hypothetical protein
METEVLIYLQKIKSYLNTNEEAREYFIGDSSIDEFYNHLSIISNKNFETSGQPELTREQFELLRMTIKVTAIRKQRVFYSDDKLFLYLDDFPGICMN